MVKTKSGNLTGQTFGCLHVIQDSGKRNSDCVIIWDCVCDPLLGGCGRTLQLNTRSFSRYKRTHCGCKKPQRLCSKCKTKIPERSKRKDRYCRNCRSIISIENRDKNPELSLLRIARYRAKKSNRPFSITLKDVIIPKVCPIFGIPLKRERKAPMKSTPSLDCIIPNLGYIPGNVEVISYRANQVKNDGSAEEHEAIARYIRENSPTLNLVKHS